MSNHYVILTLTGDYDVSQRSTLRAELAAVEDSDGLIVDLSGVTFIDSSCVGELVSMHGARVAAGHPPLTVVQDDFIVKRLFELLGLNLVFHVVDTLDEVVPDDAGAIVRQYAAGGDSRASVADTSSKTSR
jgi:anti-anti-sigma factor